MRNEIKEFVRGIFEINKDKKDRNKIIIAAVQKKFKETID